MLVRFVSAEPGRDLLEILFSPWVCSFLSRLQSEKCILFDQISFCWAADVDAEGSSFGGARPSQHSDVLPEQLCPEGEGRCTGDLLGPVPRQVLEVNQELLQSGVVTLPGEHGCLDEAPQARQLVAIEFYFSQSWRLDVQHGGFWQGPLPGSQSVPSHCVLTWQVDRGALWGL